MGRGRPEHPSPVRRQFRTEYPHSPSATRSNFAKRPTERNWPDRPVSPYGPTGLSSTYPPHGEQNGASTTDRRVWRHTTTTPVGGGLPAPLSAIDFSVATVAHFPDCSSRKLKEKAAATIAAARVRKTIPGRSFRPAQAIRPRVLHLMVVSAAAAGRCDDRAEGGVRKGRPACRRDGLRRAARLDR